LQTVGLRAKENEALLSSDNLSMVGQPASFIFVVIIDDDVVVCVKTKNAHNCEKNGTTAKQNVQ
jgi:hypothetical protein